MSAAAFEITFSVVSNFSYLFKLNEIIAFSFYYFKIQSAYTHVRNICKNLVGCVEAFCMVLSLKVGNVFLLLLISELIAQKVETMHTKITNV